MRLSEYIAELEAIKIKEGDLRVTSYGYDGGVVEGRMPRVEYIREKRPREYKRYYVYNTATEKAVEKVCHV